MSSTSSILFHPPISKFKLSSSPKPKLYKSLNPYFVLGLRTPKPSLPLRGRFLADKTGERYPPTTMTQTSAFRDSGSGGDDHVVQVLEQEALIDAPPRLQGLQPTLNRLSKWLVAAWFGGVLVVRHDGEAVWMAMGSVVNAMLSVGLKRVLNQERPVAGLKSDPGMPSSHAQSIFFILSFTIASAVEWLGVNQVSVIISVLALAFGSYLSWLRVSQQLHTVSQIVVGAVIGSIFSILWYLSWDAVVLQAFDSSLSVRLLVLLASAGFCLGFLVYVVRYWLKDER